MKLFLKNVGSDGVEPPELQNKDEKTFYAYDEKNRQCFIIFNSDEGYYMIAVVYDEFTVRYFYR